MFFTKFSSVPSAVILWGSLEWKSSWNYKFEDLWNREEACQLTKWECFIWNILRRLYHLCMQVSVLLICKWKIHLNLSCSNVGVLPSDHARVSGRPQERRYCEGQPCHEDLPQLNRAYRRSLHHHLPKGRQLTSSNHLILSDLCSTKPLLSVM